MEQNGSSVSTEKIRSPRELVREIEYSVPLKVRAEQDLRRIYAAENKIVVSKNRKDIVIQIGSASESLRTQEDVIYRHMQQDISQFYYPLNVKESAYRYKDNVDTSRKLVEEIKKNEKIEDDTVPEKNSIVARNILKKLRPNIDKLHGEVYFSESPTGIVLIYTDKRDMRLDNQEPGLDVRYISDGFAQVKPIGNDEVIFTTHIYANEIQGGTVTVQRFVYEHEERHIINRYVQNIWEDHSREKHLGRKLKRKSKDEIFAYSSDDVTDVEKVLLDSRGIYNFDSVLDASLFDKVIDIDNHDEIKQHKMTSKQLAKRFDQGLLFYLSRKSKDRLIYRSMVRDAVAAVKELNDFYKEKIVGADDDYIKRFTLGVFDAFDLQDFPQVTKIFKNYSVHNKEEHDS